MNNSPFLLEQTRDGMYNVVWPGYSSVVSGESGALTLMKILFDHVGVDEAMILVERPVSTMIRTMHISSLVWFTSDDARSLMASRLAEYTIPGVKFTDVYQAEKFKEHMEQRLTWKIISEQRWA